MSHLSGFAFAVLFAAAAITGAVIVTAIGKSGVSKRLGAALAAGVVLGAFLVDWISSAGHAAVASAARHEHMSAANIRADGLIGTALALTVILFVITTAASRSAATRSKARAKARELRAAGRRGAGHRRAGAVR